MNEGRKLKDMQKNKYPTLFGGEEIDKPKGPRGERFTVRLQLAFSSGLGS